LASGKKTVDAGELTARALEASWDALLRFDSAGLAAAIATLAADALVGTDKDAESSGADESRAGGSEAERSPAAAGTSASEGG